MTNLRIVFGGVAGVGKSLCEQLAKNLDVPYYSSGNLYRAGARSLGLTPEEVGRCPTISAAVDNHVDNLTREIGSSGKPFILESRLGHLLIPDAYKVLLICRFDVRIIRIAHRENLEIEVAAKKTLEREMADVLRFKGLYGYDNYLDQKHFDCVVDTTNLSKQEHLERLIKLCKGMQ
jgi:cytidylate kinase